MKNIHQTYDIKAPIEKVWEALVDPDVIEEWSDSPAIMSDRVGAKFDLWNKEITGANTKVEAPNLLEQDWYTDGWTEPSKVVFELSEQDGITTLELTHTDFPADKFDDLDSGWNDYYLGPLKDLLELA